MPSQFWRLSGGRPTIEVELTDATTDEPLARLLLADTGAGDALAGFELILHEDDCERCSDGASHSASLGGAYSGLFPVYYLRVQIPAIGFDHIVPVVGMADTSNDFDGIACFRFLNRFTYGNFGNANGFGLEL